MRFFRFPSTIAGLFVVGMVSIAPAQDPAEPPPIRYEISINGENFHLDANQAEVLKSTDHPGTTYKVAIRVADYQPCRLNTLAFDYHTGFSVVDDHGKDARTATLRHKLGFSMMVTDMGGPSSQPAKTMELLVATLEKGAKASAAKELRTSPTRRRQVGKVTVDGARMSYVDAAGIARVSMLYLVCGEKFSATCIVQCEKEDEDDCAALVRPTLESFAPAK